MKNLAKFLFSTSIALIIIITSNVVILGNSGEGEFEPESNPQIEKR